MDLWYGWNGFVFDLHQARISTIVEFQEQNPEGEWDIRQAPLSSNPDSGENAEWEARDNVRYSPPFRSLSANAQLLENNTGAIYLGVPHDRKHSAESSHRLRSISVNIEEVIGDDSADIARNGELVFNEGIPEMRLNESVYLSLQVPSHVFDTIEQAAASSATRFSLYVHLKCWHWTGLYGDSYLYIDRDEPARAEWIAITTSKVFADLSAYQLADDPRLAGSEPASHDVNVNSYEKLGEIEGHMHAIRKAFVFSLIGLFLWLIVSTAIH